MFKFSQVSFTLEGHFRHSYSRFPRNCNQTPRIWDCNYPAKFPHSSVPKPPLGLSWIQQTLAWKYSCGKVLHWTIWDSTSLQGWGGHWLSMVGELRLLVSCGFCGPPGLPVMAQHGSKPSEHCCTGMLLPPALPSATGVELMAAIRGFVIAWGYVCTRGLSQSLQWHQCFRTEHFLSVGLHFRTWGTPSLQNWVETTLFPSLTKPCSHCHSLALSPGCIITGCQRWWVRKGKTSCCRCIVSSCFVLFCFTSFS